VGKPDSGGSRGQQLGDPVAPSSGGHGEIIPQQVVQRAMNTAQIGLTKVAVEANQVLSVLCANVRRNLSSEEIELWDEYVDDYLVGRARMEEDKLAEVLDAVCKKSSEMVETQGWAKEISNAIAEKVVSDASNEEIAKRTIEEEALVDDISAKFLGYKSDLQNFTRSKFTDIISKYVVLVSKSFLLEGRLDVDSTEATEENIKVSREIAVSVLENLSTVIKTAYEAGRIYLAEKEDTNGLSKMVDA
jgi:hypothetical protein